MNSESVSERRHATWLLVMVLAVAGGLFWLANWESDRFERERMEAFRSDVADKAQISEAIIAGRLRAYDDTLRALREFYVADSAQFHERVQWLRSGPLADREILVVVVDREGYLAYTDSPNAEPLRDLRQSHFFRYFADDARDRFYADGPLFGRVTRRYSLPLARPIYDRQGAFHGVVALSVRQESLANFDPSLQLSGETTVSVVTERGALVTRSRDLAKAQGTTIPPEMLAKLLRGNKGVIASPSSAHSDQRVLAFRHLEGLPLIVYVSASPQGVLRAAAQQRTVLLSGAGIVSVLVLLLALTYLQRQKITAKFIATQQAHLKEAQRIAGMGSWELDLATNRFQWSDEMYGIFGVSRDGVHPDFDYLLSRVVESDRTAVRAAIEKAAIDGSGSIEFSMQRGDGQAREIVARFEAVRNKAGKATSLIGTVRDITEHKQAEKALRDSEHGYRTMIESAPEGVWMLDSDRRTSEVNQRMCDLLGYARDDMLGRNAVEFADEENGKIFQQQARRVPSRQTRTYEVALRHRDGHNIPTEFSASNLFNEDGSLMGVLAFVVELTERKRAEQALRDSSAQLRVFAENVPAMTISFDGNLRCLFANKHYADFFGFGAESIVGKHLREIIGDAPYREVEGHFAQVLRGHPVTYQRMRGLENGESRCIEVKLLPHMGGRGEVLGCFSLVTDITEHKLAAERIQRVAYHDSLTGLPNRLLFSDRLSQTISAGRRSGHHGALMFLDLDDFKPLNDAHGHEVGDMLLIEAAFRLKTCVREMDTVARFGGDEFVVVIGELGVDRSESTAQAGIIAEKIRAALAKPYVLKIRQEGKAEATVEHRCTASIGVALFGKHEASQEDILKRADMAMYQAKEAGSDLIRFFDPEILRTASPRTAVGR